MSEQFQLFDLLPEDEFTALKADIAKRGVLVPIEYDSDGNILDGHHRRRACTELGIKDFPTVTRLFSNEDEKEEHVVTLNVRRRHLNGQQKRKWVAWFLARHPEWTDRQIGREVGVDNKTVASTRSELEGREEIPHVSERTDSLGRKQPATKPRPAPSIFTTSRQSERAQTALTDLAVDAPAKQLDLKRAERIARENAADRRRAAVVDEVTTDGAVEIRHGDFRTALVDLAGTVDAIITDPPYEREYDELWEPLGEIARVLLKPTGVLAVMCGTRLDLVDHARFMLDKHMKRRHIGVYLTPGQRWRDQVERVAIGWKPIFLYSHPDADASERRWINDDVFTSSGAREQDTRFHHWGQNESGIADLIRGLTEPGHLVVDPFLGGGTAAVVCRDLGRRFIGCDVDASAVTISRERVG